MYPYKKYDAEFYEVVYNHDGSTENEIAILVDKIVHNELLSTDARLVDLIADYYNKSSVDCDDDICTIINHWLMYSKYKHIHTLLEYYIPIKTNYDMY